VTRRIYLIREKNTNTWCVSSKHSDFYNDFDNAAVFLKKENAEKAIKEMMRMLDPKKSRYPYWMLNNITYRGLDLGRTDIPLIIPEMKAVAFELNEVLE